MENTAEIVEEKKTKHVFLPKTIVIKSCRRNSWLPPDHDGSHRFGRTAEHLTVQIDRQTGILNTGLDSDDEKRIEKELNIKNGSLSRNKGSYWTTFFMKIPQNGIMLHPSTNIADEITYRVALVHTEIANSVEDQKKIGRAHV